MVKTDLKELAESLLRDAEEFEKNQEQLLASVHQSISELRRIASKSATG